MQKMLLSVNTMSRLLSMIGVAGVGILPLFVMAAERIIPETDPQQRDPHSATQIEISFSARCDDVSVSIRRSGNGVTATYGKNAKTQENSPLASILASKGAYQRSGWKCDGTEAIFELAVIDISQKGDMSFRGVKVTVRKSGDFEYQEYPYEKDVFLLLSGAKVL